jgi:hypothetical protein
MNFKKFLPIIFVTFSTFTYGQQTVDKFKLYGFIRNDFYYNSRQNVESIDGVYHLFPKPIEIASGVDKNGAPQAEMLSIATRLGLDLNGSDVFGAKSSGKIEADFAGFSSNYYVLRIRHAYIKLNWAKTELLLGQTWHPLFGSVMPTIPSLNAGAPFQPFNRSPQFRLKYNISSSLSVTASANYQMQYTSSGPLGPSSVYMKNAMLPDLFLGTECKTEHWISGTGIDVKTIQPVSEKLTSMAVVIYSQYATSKFQLKGKVIFGQNMSDYVMPFGYGVSDTTTTGGPKSFSNINMISGWINAVYGSKVQTGINIGYSQNLGSSENLISKNGKITTYGSGVCDQIMLNRLYRIQPFVSYNLPTLKLSLEFDLTSAEYGKLESNGRGSNPYSVYNKRLGASVTYFF